MADTDEDIGAGMTFLVEVSPGSGQPDNVTGWFELAKIFDWSPPDPQTEQVKKTHYKSPNRTHEYMPGWTDNGDFTLSGNYIEGSPTDLFLLAWKAAAENRKFRSIFLSGVQQTVSSFILGYKRSAPNEDKKSFDLTLKAAGSELQEGG